MIQDINIKLSAMRCVLNIDFVETSLKADATVLYQ